MNYISFSLNGAWEMYYQEDAYTSEEAPKLVNQYHEVSKMSDSVVENAVPGYWEDILR